MKSKNILIVLTVALLLVMSVVAAVCFLWGGPRSILAGFDKDMQTQYEQFELGTRREEVITKFGSPLRSKETFCLPSAEVSHKEALARAEKSNAVAYDLWLNGINWYYCLGFDEDALLAVKAEGND